MAVRLFVRIRMLAARRRFSWASRGKREGGEGGDGDEEIFVGGATVVTLSSTAFAAAAAVT